MADSLLSTTVCHSLCPFSCIFPSPIASPPPLPSPLFTRQPSLVNVRSSFVLSYISRVLLTWFIAPLTANANWAQYEFAWTCGAPILSISRQLETCCGFAWQRLQWLQIRGALKICWQRTSCFPCFQLVSWVTKRKLWPVARVIVREFAKVRAIEVNTHLLPSEHRRGPKFLSRYGSLWWLSGPGSKHSSYLSCRCSAGRALIRGQTRPGTCTPR